MANTNTVVSEKKKKVPRTLYYSLQIQDNDTIVDLIKNNLSGIKLSTYVSKSTDEPDDLDGITQDMNKASISELHNVTITDNVLTDSETRNYKLNTKFHTTLLYTGGKEHEHEDKFVDFIDNEYTVEIKRIGYSEDFIVLGVDFQNDIPYYGNEIKHITIGMRQLDGKKLFPKNSPNAFTDGHTIVLDQTVLVTAKILKVLQ